MEFPIETHLQIFEDTNNTRTSFVVNVPNENAVLLAYDKYEVTSTAGEHYLEPKTLEIGMVRVTPELAGKGYGRALFTRICEEAKRRSIEKARGETASPRIASNLLKLEQQGIITDIELWQPAFIDYLNMPIGALATRCALLNSAEAIEYLDLNTPKDRRTSNSKVLTTFTII